MESKSLLCCPLLDTDLLKCLLLVLLPIAAAFIYAYIYEGRTLELGDNLS